MIGADSHIYEIIIHPLLFAVLDGKFEHFDLLLVVLGGIVEDDCLKVVYRRIRLVKQAQTGKTAVAVDDTTIFQDDARLTLID